jgi:hypothetical protein
MVTASGCVISGVCIGWRSSVGRPRAFDAQLPPIKCLRVDLEAWQAGAVEGGVSFSEWVRAACNARAGVVHESRPSPTPKPAKPKREREARIEDVAVSRETGGVMGRVERMRRDLEAISKARRAG